MPEQLEFLRERQDAYLEAKKAHKLCGFWFTIDWQWFEKWPLGNNREVDHREEEEESDAEEGGDTTEGGDEREDDVDVPGEDDDVPGEDDDAPGECPDAPGEDDDAPGEDDDASGGSSDAPEESVDTPEAEGVTIEERRKGRKASRQKPLMHLSGFGKPTTRPLRPQEVYAKLHYKGELQETIGAEIKRQKIEKKELLPFINKRIQEAWEAESEEVKADVMSQVKTQTRKLEEIQETPEAYARAIDELPTASQSSLKMKPSDPGGPSRSSLGAPAPSTRAASKRWGKNAYGLTFATAHPTYAATYLKPFHEFLMGVYPKSVCDARALGSTSAGAADVDPDDGSASDSSSNLPSMALHPRPHTMLIAWGHPPTTKPRLAVDVNPDDNSAPDSGSNLSQHGTAPTIFTQHSSPGVTPPPPSQASPAPHSPDLSNIDPSLLPAPARSPTLARDPTSTCYPTPAPRDPTPARDPTPVRDPTPASAPARNPTTACGLPPAHDSTPAHDSDPTRVPTTAHVTPPRNSDVGQRRGGRNRKPAGTKEVVPLTSRAAAPPKKTKNKGLTGGGSRRKK
ncbi:hypothetical protein BD779DRAFT_1480441 [Infundibulicybe gibba]|nr:hypothetical protein BD779DRAFT_1480441 [Infundibulicybe gibba]